LSDPDTGLLYRWNGRFWEAFNVDHVKRMAIEMLGEEAMSARVRDAIFQVMILATLPHGRVVNDITEWICMKNGMLNYKTLEIRDHAMNISTEVGAKAIESPYFKAITAGDPINAAFKHKDTFDFVPYCKLIFTANRLPRVLDNSDGVYRRILPVLFKRQFLEETPGQYTKEIQHE